MSYRYIGNKSRLLPILREAVRQRLPAGATVADLMCGTASVSEALRMAGYRVVASDIMTYAVHHARVRLLLEKPPAFRGLRLDGYPAVLAYLNGLPPHEGIFFNEYSPDGRPANGVAPRKYFTSNNARQIDAITRQLNEWRSKNRLSELENALLRHDLILSSNRVANIAGTYGHHRSKWSTASLTPLFLRATAFLSGLYSDHAVLQGEAENISSRINVDLCYIDPPYMKRQYAANYHIIETIARGDAPKACGVSGLRPWRDQYSDFCSKRKIFDAFRKIFNSINCDQFLISYSEDGLLSESVLYDLFSEVGVVCLKKIPFTRFKSNVGGRGGNIFEYLFYIKR